MKKIIRFLPAIGIVMGIVFIASQVSALKDYRHRRHWRPVPAIVESAEIAGKRAFHPEVVLRYTVDGHPYSMITSMNVPGFGSKRNRLDVAERITASLAVGDTLTVFIDPDFPADAVISRNLSYSTYLILTTGFCFLILGTAFLFRQRSQSQ
jgi:hypothetical protein